MMGEKQPHSPSPSRYPPLTTRSESLLAPNPDEQGWVNPRRPLTAVTIPSGGVAGGVRLRPLRPAPPPSRNTPIHRQPPPPTAMKIPSAGVAAGLRFPSSRPKHPYHRQFIRRHLPVATLPTADDITDYEADLSPLGDGLAGGGNDKRAEATEDEGEGDAEDSGDLASCSPFSGVQSIPIDDPVAWARAEAEADAWMEEMERNGKFDGSLW